jgi:thiamine-phosphate pyrophosphorylase
MIRYYVTDRRQGDVVTFSKRAVGDGVDMIQVREKDLLGKELLDLVRAIRDLAAGTHTRVLVNDRLDVAMAAGIDGVHLPGNGLPIERVRGLVKVVGASTHSVEETVMAEKAGADFVVFGPVFETPGKTPVGLEALRQAAGAVKIPVLAIGGITETNTTQVLNAGAAGIAAIRMFQGAGS